jgi:hypothetical protein
MSSSELSILVQTQVAVLPLGGVMLMLWAWILVHFLSLIVSTRSLMKTTELTEGLLQTSVPTFGSYLLEVVPHIFLKTMSEMIMLDCKGMSVIQDSGRRNMTKDQGSVLSCTYRVLVAKG